MRSRNVAVKTEASGTEQTDIASLLNIGDTVICLIDEWRKGSKSAFDGQITTKNEKGVDVLYLSSFRSRNDFVEWHDIVAKLDKSLPWIELDGYGFSGHFNVFKICPNPQK
jgi:hypothetical protein